MKTKVTAKILSFTMCIVVLFTPTSVFAQSTQIEQAEEATQAFYHSLKFDTVVMDENADLYWHTETTATKTYPPAKRSVQVIVDGIYDYRGVISLVEVTLTGSAMAPTFNLMTLSESSYQVRTSNRITKVILLA